MTEELLPCPFCNKSDMLREMDECDDILVDCQRCEASTWKDIWQSRAQPKYKRVDLDDLKWDGNSHQANAFNSAFDLLKSKYGDLYVEAKSRFSDEVVEVK